jgi:hypothetical protein
MFIDFQNAELPKNIGEARRGVVTASEEISILCRTIALFCPQLEEKRAFQNEIVAVTGAAQPEESALKPVLDEDQSEIHVALDAYEHSYILALLSSLGPLHIVLVDTPSPAVPMLPLRVWVHCPRASNGLLPPRSYLVGYLRWHAGSDSVFFLPPSDNHSNSFQVASQQTLP